MDLDLLCDVLLELKSVTQLVLLQLIVILLKFLNLTFELCRVCTTVLFECPEYPFELLDAVVQLEPLCEPPLGHILEGVELLLNDHVLVMDLANAGTGLPKFAVTADDALVKLLDDCLQRERGDVLFI